MNTICGWVCFGLISWAWLLPTVCYLAGPLEPQCWFERRLIMDNYQPRTELRKVCEVG